MPVDFSPWSQGAIRLALAVAPQAELILLHADEVAFEGKLRFAGVAEEVIRRRVVKRPAGKRSPDSNRPQPMPESLQQTGVPS